MKIEQAFKKSQYIQMRKMFVDKVRYFEKYKSCKKPNNKSHCTPQELNVLIYEWLK